MKFWQSASAIALVVMIAHGTPAFAASTAEQEVPIASRTLTGALLSAQVAEGDNDPAAMVAYYRQALGFAPGNVEFEQRLLLALLADGKFDEALPFAEKLKTVAAIERVSRVALAIDAGRNGKWDDAQNLLKLALQSDLDRLVTGLMDGWAKLGAGNGKAGAEAIAGLKGPSWFGLFQQMHKGLILEASGDKEGAAKAYDLALTSPDGNAAPDTWLRLVETYAGFAYRGGDKDKALKIIAQGQEIAPERPSLVALRKAVEAGSPVEPLVAKPIDGFSEVLYNLGSAIRRDGAESFSKLYIQLALAAKPASDVALLERASLNEAMDKPQSAIEDYKAVPQTSPFRRGADLQAGLVLADVERTDEAVTMLAGLIDKDPADTRAYLALGGVHAANKDFAAAAAVYDKAVTAIGVPDQNDWNLFYQRGIAHERIKDWPVAEQSFRQALKLYPDQPQVLNYLGYSFVDRNENLDEALGMIRKAVELRPDDGYIVDSLGWAYYRLGKFEDAVSELESAIQLKPEDATINDHLGDAYWRAGRKLEARFQWQHALDAKSEDVDNELIKAKLGAAEPKVAESVADKKG